MSRLLTPIAVLVAACALQAFPAAAAPSNDATVTMTGIVPTQCEASFAGAPDRADGDRIDLGLLTRRCNNAEGYRLILHSPSTLAGAVFVLGNRRVPLSDSGETVVIDSDRDERSTEPAHIELGAAPPPESLQLRLVAVPKGTIF